MACKVHVIPSCLLGIPGGIFHLDLLREFNGSLMLGGSSSRVAYRPALSDFSSVLYSLAVSMCF